MQHIIIIIIVAGSQILLASSSRADSTLAKRYIMHHFVHELPAGADTLPYSEFEKLLDRYTWIMSVDEAKEFKTTYRGESFGRIGISSRNHILGIVIDGVAPGSPAYYAGLSAGDIITAINDSSLMVDVARKVSRVTRFRGKSGTPIGIEYMRNGRCHRAVVHRADLDEPALTWVVAGRTLAIHITMFTHELGAEFHAMSEQVRPDEIDTILFDVRDNGGGSVSAATSILRELLDAGDTMYVAVGRHERDASIAYGFGKWIDDRTIIVLQDSGSASAAELFTGALAVHRDAIVVGTTSYGKGSMQQIVIEKEGNPDNDPKIGGIRVTWARWLAGGRLPVQDVGIAPTLPYAWPNYATIPVSDSLDIVQLRHAIEQPTPRQIDSIVARYGHHTPLVVWDQRARAYMALLDLKATGLLYNQVDWICSVDHDTLPTEYTRAEEVALRRVLVRQFPGRLNDSLRRLEPVEALLHHMQADARVITTDSLREMRDVHSNIVRDLGLGVELVGSNIVVTTVHGASSAYDAGISVGDILLRLNGVPLPQSAPEVQKLLYRHADGGSVKLEIRRGQRQFTLAVDGRGRNITVPQTYVDGQTGYILMNRLSYSPQHSYHLWRAMAALHDSGVRSIVIDARGCTGGSPTLARELLAHVAREGDTLQVERDMRGRHAARTAVRDGDYRGMLLHIVVDSTSQDMAEVIAQGIQRNRYGKVIGSATRGGLAAWSIDSISNTNNLLRVEHRYVMHPAANVTVGIAPDIDVHWPTLSLQSVRNVTSNFRDIRSLRTQWHEPTQDLLEDIIQQLPIQQRSIPLSVVATAIYGEHARLFILARLMPNILNGLSPITRR